MTSNLFRLVVFLTVISVFKFALATPRFNSDFYRKLKMTSEEWKDAVRGVSRRGAEIEYSDDTFPTCNNDVNKNHIPEQFDARQKWPYCPSLWEISDQGNCASCWALAVTSMLTDRYCIANRGDDNYEFSAFDLLTCGANETAWELDDGILGCKGGNVPKALKYIQEKGVVSGGPYRSQGGWGCKPYGIRPCNHAPKHYGFSRCDSESNEGDTPGCSKECQFAYNVAYDNDMKTMTSACAVKSEVEEIQMEIMKNGPVVAVMKLWNSFFSYNTSEVFIKRADMHDFVVMNHAVKIVGWGTAIQDGTEVPYWEVANSFNYYWGNNGFFRILRGGGGAGASIESKVTAGIFENSVRVNLH